MNTLKVDYEFFKGIKFEDTLNYKHNANLEKSIGDIIDYLEIEMNILSKKKAKPTQDQRAVYFLKMALFYITTDPACIKAMEECSTSIDNNYIHVIIKKHYFKMECNLEDLSM